MDVINECTARTAKHADLPSVRSGDRRIHADRRLPVLLALPGLRRAAQTQGRRLLRVLQLRHRQVPAQAVGEELLLS